MAYAAFVAGLETGDSKGQGEQEREFPSFAVCRI